MAGRMEARPMAEATEIDEVVDDDRQPDFLHWPDSEPELPEIDGNRAVSVPAAPSGAPARTGRRRRRRRWRGGPRQPAPGSPSG